MTSTSVADVGWGVFLGAATLMLGVGVQRIVSPVNANNAISEGAPSPSVLPVGRLRRGFRSATCGGSLIAAGIVTLTTLTLSRRSVAPSLRANRVSSMASSDGPDADRERELQGLWANAYDGWIDVPGESGGAIYTRPVGAPGVRTHVPFPPIVTASRLFALTGFNPMGEERPIAENRAANEKLRADIEAMTPAPKAWWRAFGFAHDWREDGFVLAYETRDGDAGEKAAVDLAVKYGQGAIYAYSATANDAGNLRRRTVPAAMGQTVEADVEVERCDRPGLKFADPALPDEEY